MPAPDDPGLLTLRRLFVRRAMGLQTEFTDRHLLDVWMSHKALRVARIELRTAYDEEDVPQEADDVVDGDPEGEDWDESATDWMDKAKAAAVRRAVACLINDPRSLPGIGRRVERIVRRVGTVDIYFDDGSFVSATVEDPQPSTNEEAAVIERVYGTRTAAPTVDMVAALRRRELLGARDARKFGVKSPRYWASLVGAPFHLHLLRDVPLPVARDLADFPQRKTRIRTPRQAFALAQPFADARPFARVAVSR